MAEESAVNYWEVRRATINHLAPQVLNVRAIRTEICGCSVQCEPKGGPHHLCAKNETKDHVEQQFGRHRLPG